MLRRLLRHDLGQASIDYVTVLAITGVALAAGTGVALAKAPAFAGAVTGQMVRALCIVTGGDCDRDRAPCVVGSTEESTSGTVSLALFRLGRDQLAVVEERSDGRFDVTVVDGWNPGAELAFGGRLRIPRTDLALDGEVRAALLAHRRKGMTWTVDSARAAKRLVDRMSGVKTVLGPSVVRGVDGLEPDLTYEESGWSFELAADGNVSEAEGSIRLRADDFDGSRRDRRTGHVTHYLKRSQDLGAALALPVDGERASGDLTYEGGYVWAIETDARGRPVDLMILGTDEYRGTASLPAVAAQVAGYLGVPGRLAERYEVEQHLDLTDPVNLRAAMAFIHRVAGPFKGSTPFTDRVPVSAALQERLDRVGTVHARTYRTDHSSDGGGASLAAGLKIGAEYETTSHTSTLIGAATRGPGGIWRDRTDCVDR